MGGPQKPKVKPKIKPKIKPKKVVEPKKRPVKMHADGFSLNNLINDHEVREFRKAFELFDTDSSGTISSTELITAMMSLNLRPKEEEIQELIRVKNKEKNRKPNMYVLTTVVLEKSSVIE